MTLKSLSIGLALAMLVSPASAADFSFTFDWGDLKRCTSGSPNTVPNPEFKLKSVPNGTQFIRFRMTDRNAPGYNHGGGIVAYSGKNTIAPGAFKYKSPCPPGGQHTYEWKATAQSSKNGGKLGTATARQKYP